ncbi:CTP synthase [Thalassiosira pseudonana CCMP1335]|uniref:CTP synthase n=1 Tax=Thalassiosira pseudonana TaxID=35128 RepID=B5YN22_THAPS|nr:CTP synthase [Thalassiosira pseudonana CCMP1335]ACI64907.1 CTP synthase [Thalassiosira pseudonana CCMP1335]
MKYIVVTGGVVSGLGKGVTISSMGRMLQGCGLRVTSIKIDPYLNVDAGTMSPFEHGECFVLNDGGETDLDLGNYERFLSISLTSDHNITTGKIYRKVISKERRGDYLGKTVQVVPHITDEIQSWIEEVAQIPVDDQGNLADICLIEVGGTVGDIESSVFLEALRQFQFRVGPSNFCLTFVSLVPIMGEEQKTKPTQHGVRDLRSVGLSPTVIFCRCKEVLEESTKIKIASFCHVGGSEAVLSVHDVSNVYHVPLLLMEQKLHRILAEKSMTDWARMAFKLDGFEEEVKIVIVGKYTGLQDSYLSVIKSLKHASMAVERKLDLIWVEAAHLENDFEDETMGGELEYNEAWDKMKSADGVVVPGGFGTRGFLGKILAAKYCRENAKPYLGVCLGFQAMVVEYSRNILKWEDANSTEFDEKTTNPVVFFMPEIDKDNMGGTMRLGSRNTKFTHPTHDDGSPSISKIMYGGSDTVSERHRHRYEVNPERVDTIHEAGLKFVGRDETGTRMEIAELPRSQHPYYVGCQYHPEFKSRPLNPSPPFHGLLLAACGMLDDYVASHQK